jgi:hypothetical protein
MASTAPWFGMTVADLHAERLLIDANATPKLQRRKAKVMPVWLEYIKEQLRAVPVQPGCPAGIYIMFSHLQNKSPTAAKMAFWTVTPADARDLTAEIQANGTSGFTVTTGIMHPEDCDCPEITPNEGCEGYLLVDWTWPTSTPAHDQ